MRLASASARHDLITGRHPSGFLLHADHLSGHRRLRLRVFDLARERGEGIILTVAVWLPCGSVATLSKGGATVSGMQHWPTSLRRLLDTLDAGDQVSDRTGDCGVLWLERARDLRYHRAPIPTIWWRRNIFLTTLQAIVTDKSR
jgi:hypothetical protein